MPCPLQVLSIDAFRVNEDGTTGAALEFCTVRRMRMDTGVELARLLPPLCLPSLPDL